MNQRSYLSIGDVLTLLRTEFPDVTISKIRFLESQGLVSPQRSPSGYRKFYDEDVERLRYVLLQQREHFLPLKVIRDRLNDGEPISSTGVEAAEASVTPVAPAAAAFPAAPRSEPKRETSVADVLAALQEAPIAPPASVATTPKPTEPDEDRAVAKVVEQVAPPSDALTAEELADQTGLSLAEIASLEEYGILRSTRIAGLACFSGDEVAIARAAQEFCSHGVEPRHLRGFRTSVDREMDLYEQLMAPLLHQRNPEARVRAAASVEAMAEAGRALRIAMMTAAVDRLLGR